jgi:hypothetical protein
MGGSPVEDVLAGALRECALDTLDEALATGAFDGVVVVADESSAAALQSRLPRNAQLDIDQADEVFHLGQRLAEVIRRYELERPVYTGCGLPLVKGDELAAVARALVTQQRTVVSNNYYSADLVGLTPGSVVADLELPNNDRVLPRLLVQEAGFTHQALPRTMANQFDVDTPVDLAILAYAGGAGPHLEAYLEGLSLDSSALAKAAWLFTDPMAEVLVAGRVGSQVWQFLETETACRIRIVAEERGMQAMGRDLNGEARSLLGFHIESVGPERFFSELAETVNAAFIDTRPLLAHLRLNPSRQDRFLSDAMTPEGIADPWLRDFTKAAREAPIPVVLGGNTLVAAGVQLLSEAAWRARDKSEVEYKAKGRAARN